MRGKILRITTVPISLHKLLQGQPQFMIQNDFEIILASADGKEISKIEQETGLKVHILPLTRKISPIIDLKALWKTYKLIKQTQPDIVHTHTPKAGIIGMLAAKFAGVPVRMHTVAGMPLLETTGIKRRILKLVEKLTYKSATGVYPNSFGLKDIILKNGLTNPKKLKVLANGSSNGIDLNYFNPELYPEKDIQSLRIRLNISNNDFVFSFVGRLVGDKGINELVNAFIRLQKKHKHIKLLLIGNEEPHLDPLKPEVKQEIQNNKDIITTGWVDDVRPYFAISNGFVFPSYREGMPNVVMQAGAMGLASIVSDINGCNEIIQDHINGLIIPVKNTEVLFEAMRKLLTQKELLLKLQENARPSIQSRFEQKMVWQALLDEYQKQLNLIKK